MKFKYSLRGLVGGLFGLMLSVVGFSFMTWQFWVLFLIFLIYGTVNQLDLD